MFWGPLLFGVIMIYVIGVRCKRRGNDRIAQDSETSLALPGAQQGPTGTAPPGAVVGVISNGVPLIGGVVSAPQPSVCGQPGVVVGAPQPVVSIQNQPLVTGTVIEMTSPPGAFATGTIEPGGARLITRY